MRAAVTHGMDGRARIFAEGPSALSEPELVAILLRAGGRGREADALALRLLADGLGSLRRAGLSELLLTRGLGESQALRIAAALELGRRALVAPCVQRLRLLRAKDLVGLLWPRLAHLGHEEFWAVLLTARLEEIRAVRIAQGGLTQCSVLPREALAPALLYRAAAVAFVHNHPSGDPLPSPDDLRMQLLLDEGARTLGIRVVDHLVLAESGAHSAVEGRVAWPAPVSLVPQGSVG